MSQSAPVVAWNHQPRDHHSNDFHQRDISIDDMVSQHISLAAFSPSPQRDCYYSCGNLNNNNNTPQSPSKDTCAADDRNSSYATNCASNDSNARPPPTDKCICAAMSCSHGRDTQQAQPLLVGSNMINEWPTRNGSVSTNNSNSAPLNSLRRNRNSVDKAAAVSDDKSDAYSMNGAIAVEVPTSVESAKKDFLPEKFKTFVALLILLFSFFFTTISLAIVHDRVPDRRVYKPLPDTFLDLVAARDWALSVSEIFIMITTNITLVVVLLHKHRYIVFRRMFLILSLLYFMRSITMFVTVLPVSSETYECSEKVKHPTVGVIVIRALQLCSGLGLTINGKHTYCGDYIYSGHTTILVMGYLMICEYSPRRYYLLHWSAWVMAFVGVLMVLVSHGHYTVDVIVAYFITTRLFWVYHTLANNQSLKDRTATNYLARAWWFPFFRYFEGNIHAPVPLEYNLPIRWPPSWSGSYRCTH